MCVCVCRTPLAACNFRCILKKTKKKLPCCDGDICTDSSSVKTKHWASFISVQFLKHGPDSDVGAIHHSFCLSNNDQNMSTKCVNHDRLHKPRLGKKTESVMTKKKNVWVPACVLVCVF